MQRVSLVVIALMLLVVLGSGAAIAAVKIGTTKSDVIKGTNQNDVLVGGHGNDKIYGKAGQDQLYGDPGKDTLVGGEGDDLLNAIDGQGGDIVDCGPGIDQWYAEYNDTVKDSCFQN